MLCQSYFRNGIKDENGVWVYSINLCIQEFREAYPDHDVDYDNLRRNIRRLVERFNNTGSVAPGKSPGRPTVANEEVVEDVRARLEQSPNKSLRKLCNQTGLSYGTCHGIVKKKLHFYPYKITVLQELHQPDFQKRVDYCNWFNGNLRDNNMLDKTFFSDEAWFHLSGYVNSQNYRTWSAENPHVYQEAPLHPLKVGVWIAMSRRRIVGPIFFDDTVNAERYRAMLQVFIDQLHEDELQEGFFQHDNATAHTAAATVTFIQQYFDDRMIGRNLWPPRSPDLTPLDYFLFGYLKNVVHRNRLHTLEELRAAIEDAVSSIGEQELRAVYENMKKRVDMCLQSGGDHFEHLL